MSNDFSQITCAVINRPFLLRNLQNKDGSGILNFYVPKKTRIVGFFADGSGSLLDASANVALVFRGKKPGFYGIKVPEGQDGKLWKFHQSTGTKRLMTVPPCLASNSRELLLPPEVVEADCN